ncbi:hypothetical protein [Caulobacter sp. NIBR2454]|uniref:hypothetical protein n=1 Tax=Caulobacter sp. NIBR2454 TaxID=3015996 RepID=UPI0022B74CE8|nr:hypothetical protein [Caulobacter sp. NIBR2454]
MAIGPVSGNGIPVTLPSGKVVFWSALVQSSGNQFIQVKDGSGNVVFTAQGASSSGGTPTQIGQGFFQAADPNNAYTVYLGTNGGGQWSKVIWSEDVLSSGATIYMGKYVFTTEDSTDADYNDTYLQMQWFQYVG